MSLLDDSNHDRSRRNYDPLDMASGRLWTCKMEVVDDAAPTPDVASVCGGSSASAPGSG
jgi:hypothetical protein